MQHIKFNSRATTEKKTAEGECVYTFCFYCLCLWFFENYAGKLIDFLFWQASFQRGFKMSALLVKYFPRN